MALTIQTLSLPNGLSTTNAYARIESVKGNKTELSLTLQYFISQSGYMGGKRCLLLEYYSFEPSVEDDAANFIKQGYEYLKALPKFEDALDA